jgi:glycosyl transferase family 1
LTRDGVVSPGEIAVHLIGDVRSTMDGSVDDLIASYGLADCVRIIPAVSYAESLQRMAASDLLLLFQPHQYCSVPAKAFEYLATRKPILCLAHEGATADLIESTHAGVVVDPEDVGAIKSALVTYLDRFRSGQPGANGRDISAYERRALAKQLSGVLTDIDQDTSASHTSIRDRQPVGRIRFRRGYALFTVAYMGVIAWLSLRPEFATDPTARIPSLVADLLHVPAYAGLVYCMLQTTRGRRGERQQPWEVIALALLVTAVFGALTEWGQLFVPGRYASGADFFLDLVGMLGVAFAVWMPGRRPAQ